MFTPRLLCGFVCIGGPSLVVVLIDFKQLREKCNAPERNLNLQIVERQQVIWDWEVRVERKLCA